MLTYPLSILKLYLQATSGWNTCNVDIIRIPTKRDNLSVHQLQGHGTSFRRNGFGDGSGFEWTRLHKKLMLFSVRTTAHGKVDPVEAGRKGGQFS